MKQILKLGFTLAVFAVVSCFALALVNHITSPIIAEYKIQKANAAMKAVFADADGFEELTEFPASSDTAIALEKMYFAKKAGETVGIIVQATGPTYDKATMMIGFQKDGVLSGVQFLALSDTPGFGLKANDPSYTVASGKTFVEQFAGKDAKAGFTIGETFDAVSGATITSKGVSAILNASAKSALEVLKNVQ